jgi:outer membrane protein
MKKLTVVLYVALFLLVAVLYYFQFFGNKNRKSVNSGNIVSSSALGIVYVNIDSIIFNFDMFKDKRNDLVTKQKNAEGELNTKVAQFQKDGTDYQNKVNKGLVTRAQAAQIEQVLTNQQQELVTLKDKLQTDLMEEEQVMNRQVIDYITKYLDENKADYNYQFILGKSFGSVVLYSDSSLEITKRVLDALNKKYKSEKK